MLSLKISSMKKLTKIAYKMNNIEMKRSLGVTSSFDNIGCRGRKIQILMKVMSVNSSLQKMMKKCY